MSTRNNTIAAIATPSGTGALGVVRLSGVAAVDIVRKIFVPVKGEWKPRSHRMVYGTIVNGSAPIDEVMLCYMRAPRSFTREDVVEIYAHGGALPLHGVLNAALENGARLALPGEFTQRAFLNGRINLTQAEAVMDIINASSDTARTAGLRQLGGGLSNKIQACRNAIMKWLAHISLSIDYPEHEEEAANRETILHEASAVLNDMQALLKTAVIGRILREGIKTAIVGAPNAGKSTLLNAILGEDRAITHELPGTTRDTLTEQIQIGGIPLVLIDTAGLRETDDPVEQIGVTRSFAAARDAQLILYVVDGSEAGQALEYGIHEGQQQITIINKCDLPQEVHQGLIDVGSVPTVSISAKTGQGMDALFTAIQQACLTSGTSIAQVTESDVITRERHRILLEQAIAQINNALNDLRAGVAEDIAAIELRGAYLSLGHILGVEYADDIVDRIFAEFCVGK